MTTVDSNDMLMLNLPAQFRNDFYETYDLLVSEVWKLNEESKRIDSLVDATRTTKRYRVLRQKLTRYQTSELTYLQNSDEYFLSFSQRYARKVDLGYISRINGFMIHLEYTYNTNITKRSKIPEGTVIQKVAEITEELLEKSLTVSEIQAIEGWRDSLLAKAKFIHDLAVSFRNDPVFYSFMDKVRAYNRHLRDS